MTAGVITLQGFQYAIAPGEGNKLVGGQPTDEKIQLKILTVKDAHSQLQMNLVFTEDEFEAFIANMRDTNIIPAPSDFFTRGRQIPVS